jgi:hypothetical protein
LHPGTSNKQIGPGPGEVYLAGMKPKSRTITSLEKPGGHGGSLSSSKTASSTSIGPATGSKKRSTFSLDPKRFVIGSSPKRDVIGGSNYSRGLLLDGD